MIRCEFVCSQKRAGYDAGTHDLAFGPVYSGSEENKEFFRLTPSGLLTFSTVNESAASQVEVGKEYYIDISPAEVAAK